MGNLGQRYWVEKGTLIPIYESSIPMDAESWRQHIEKIFGIREESDAEKYSDIARKRALRKDAPSFQVGLRCSGSIHRVIWTERGRVRLMDHSKEDLKALKTLRSLGDESCACLAMLARFKRGGVESDGFLKSKQHWKAPRESAVEARKRRRGRLAITDMLQIVNGKRFQPLSVDFHRDELQKKGAAVLGSVLAGVAPHAQIGVQHGPVPEVAVARPFRWNNYQHKLEWQGHVVQAVLPISWLRLNSLNLGRVAVAWPGRNGATKTGSAFGLKLLREEPEGWLVHVAVLRRVEGVILFAYRNAFFGRGDSIERNGITIRVGQFARIQAPVVPEPTMADVAIEELA